MKKKIKYEFSQITTRGGDHGESTLFNGERRRKDDSLFFLLGDLDELSSSMGVAIAGIKRFGPLPADDERTKNWLKVMDTIQGKLIILGGMAANPDNRSKLKLKPLSEKDTEQLETFQAELMKLTEFPRELIHPGSTIYSAWIDVARTVCRRCERRVVKEIRDSVMTALIPCQVYLNRLSDFLFVSARYWEQISEES